MEQQVKTTYNADAPAEYGFPNDSFDFPYMVTDNDATTGESYDFASDGGAPRPFAYVSNESTEDFRPLMPGNQGKYELQWNNGQALIPSNDTVSVVPVAGSTDLSEARDTPYFAPGTNRLIRSDGPVAGTPEDNYTGEVSYLGRDIPGVDGPVGGDGAGYAHSLAMTTQAALFQQYSQTAALSALVSSV
jgi:hypothetical protein